LVGLAAVIASLALVLFGVGSASATRLCKTNTLPCANVLESGTTFKAELAAGNEAIFTSGFAVVKCKGSTMEEKATSAGGGEEVSVSGEITAASNSSCSCNLGGAVTTKAEALPWSTSLNYSSEMNGTTKVSNPQWSFVCINIKCVYVASSKSFMITGGSPAFSVWTVTFNLIPSLSDFLCSPTMTLKVVYRLGNIAAPADGLYIAPN